MSIVEKLEETHFYSLPLCLLIPPLTLSVCVCVSGWQTHWLCGWPDSGQTYWSGEEEEQGGSVSQTLPGGVTSAAFLTQAGFIAHVCWKLIDLPVIGAPGEEPYLGVCERTDREPLLWLPDQGEYDTPDQELWVQVPFVRQVHQGCKDTSYSLSAPSFDPCKIAGHQFWKRFVSLSPTGNQLWDRWKYTQLGEVQSSDAAE